MNFLTLTECIRQDYYLDIEKKVTDLKLNFILKEFSIDAHFLKAIISNAISNNDRIKYLEAIANLGLNLYGTDNWTAVGQYSISLLKAFQFDKRIDTRKKLVEVYQRSKISINISHNQAVNGLPYRIFDIMASDSMLITNYRKDSDIFLLFGNDFTIPMYRDDKELRREVKHYLDNEDERLQIVKECQKAIAHGFSFAERVKQFYEIAGKNLEQSFNEKGKVIFLNENIFQKSLHRRVMSLNQLENNGKREKIYLTFLSILLLLIRLGCRKLVAAIVKSTTQKQRHTLKYWLRSLTTEHLRTRVDIILRGLGIERTHD